LVKIISDIKMVLLTSRHEALGGLKCGKLTELKWEVRKKNVDIFLS